MMSLASALIEEFSKIAFMGRNTGEVDDPGVTRQSGPAYESMETKNLDADAKGTYLDVPGQLAKHNLRSDKADPTEGNSPDARDVQSRMNDTVGE